MEDISLTAIISGESSMTPTANDQPSITRSEVPNTALESNITVTEEALMPASGDSIMPASGEVNRVVIEEDVPRSANECKKQKNGNNTAHAIPD